MVSDFLSTGRFRVLVFASHDLLKPSGASSQALKELCKEIIPKFPPQTVELVVLHPFIERAFEWIDIPSCVREFAEMNLHGPIDDQLYKTYGVRQDTGAIVIVRPDGYVGSISSLEDLSNADNFLSSCLVKVS